jgi:hypothetical protein
MRGCRDPGRLSQRQTNRESENPVADGVHKRSVNLVFLGELNGIHDC